MNPYQAPQADLLDAPVPYDELGEGNDAEVLRRRYLKHEASVKSIGLLHYFGACIWTLAVVGAAVLIVRATEDVELRLRYVGAAALYGSLAALNFALGRGVRRLQTWARWTDVVLTAALMALVLLGTIMTAVTASPAAAAPNVVWLLFNAYILSLLLSAKGRMVFSPEYRAAVELTPHIRYKTSPIVKIACAVLVAVLVVALLGVALVGRR